MNNTQQTLHPYLALAKRAITYAAKNRQPYKATKEDLNTIKGNAKPLFVSIKKHGTLRGCMGTLEAIKPSLGAMIAYCASMAAIDDPRFMPISEDELDALTISIDIVNPFEIVEDTAMLDPQIYGILVTSYDKQGLLLPALKGIDSIEQQLRIALEKAGIHHDESFTIKRFTVTRYHETNLD